MMNAYFENKINKYYDNDTAKLIFSGLSVKRYTTFRVNNIKSNFEYVMTHLDFEYELKDDFKDAFISISKDEKYISSLDIYKNGFIYMQSLSSMKPIYILEPKEKENILDMCAAPGSKTTFIQSLTYNKTNLTAVELHNDRFLKLKYNVDLQGANCLLINKNALFLDDMLKFDKILLDAPCSGSGIIDLNYDNKVNLINEDLVKKTTNTQKKLIKKSFNLLKKGGILVYSTCSLFNEENEENIEYAKSIGYKIIKIDNKDFIKILPDKYFEGFFICKFVKE